MAQNNVFGIAPFGPFVEGFIRFSFEEDTATKTATQLSQFEILSHVHDGVPSPGDIPKMLTHPCAQQLTAKDSEDGTRRLLHEVPIRFLGKTPETNLRARYEAFDVESGRMVCSGNGVDGARLSAGAAEAVAVPCVGPDRCSFAQNPGVSCKFRCRMDVQLESSTDPLAVFQFQSGGINTYRTLAAKLKMLHAVYGDLRGLPLRLTSWAKSSKLSGYATFHCANIELQDGISLKEAGEKAKAYRDEFNMDGLEAVLHELANDSAFALDDSETLVTRHVPTSELRRARDASGHAQPPIHSTLESVVASALESVGNDSKRNFTADVPAVVAPVTESPVIVQSEIAAKISNVVPVAVPVNENVLVREPMSGQEDEQELQGNDVIVSI